MKKRKVSSVIFEIVRYAIFLVAICAFTYSAYSITKTMLEYKEGDDEYSQINDMFWVSDDGTSNKDNSSDKKPSNDDNDKKWIFNYDKLVAINSEAKGYIKQEGTLINYPVLQGTNNAYYLYHTIDNTYNRNGSIFIDYRIAKGFDSKNCIIYGHNMWTDTMFGTLVNYKDKEYLEKHPQMDVYAGNKHYIYKVFASYECNAYGDDVYTFDFENNDAFLKWANAERARSYVDTSNVRAITKKDHVITLSTCTTRGSDTKRVIVLLYRDKLV